MCSRPTTSTHIPKLLGYHIQTSTRLLPLAEPPSELIGVDVLQCSKDRQGAHADIGLGCMAFASRPRSKTTIEIAAADNILDRLFKVQSRVVQSLEKAEAVDCTKDGPSICLPTRISTERAILILKRHNIYPRAC